MIRSAGLVLFRLVDNEYKFLLLRAYNYFDFPKGRQEHGETLIQTAFRETEEEAGILKEDIVLASDIGYTTEPYAKPQKTATYFLALSNTDKVLLQPNPTTGRLEHHEYRWMNYEEGKKLCNSRILGVLNWANEQLQIVSMPQDLINKAFDLVKGVEVDLNKPLTED